MFFSRGNSGDGLRVVKKGLAQRVVFFYPGEEGTYIDNAHVTLYATGIVHIEASNEVTTTHLQHCEILWRFQEMDTADSKSRGPATVRLLKPRGSELQPEQPEHPEQ